MKLSTRMVVLRRNFDTDAQAYITAVETADGAALEGGVKTAINNFVVGCKADGIWSAIKASCILAGARTLTGALVPLVGTAPTNFNFVSGDYNRKTGLVGNGFSKYLDSNRANNADPQNRKHLSCFTTVTSTGVRSYVAGGIDSWIARDEGNFYFRANQATSLIPEVANSVIGFFGISRSGSAIFVVRFNSTNILSSISSVSPAIGNIDILRKANGTQFASDRIAFYSIGESLDLALLDARVTALINAYSTAIV